MCPTELGYDANVAPSLRLLPIETRLQMQSLAEWRVKSDRWHEIPLDVGNADQIAKALEKSGGGAQGQFGQCACAGFLA